MNFKTFYDNVRKSITLTSENVRGFDFIIAEAAKRKVPLHHLAYILATVFHETAHRMQPIREYGRGKGRPYGSIGRNGQAPYGRGYVQLTWDENYERADKELGLGGKLVRNYDLALQPSIAVQILFKGMAEGWFTGKSLSDFIDTIDEPDAYDREEYEGARRIINGVDKKALIASYALIFEKALRNAGYRGAKALPAPTKPKTKSTVPDAPSASATIVEILIKFIMTLIRGGK